MERWIFVAVVVKNVYPFAASMNLGNVPEALRQVILALFLFLSLIESFQMLLEDEAHDDREAVGGDADRI